MARTRLNKLVAEAADGNCEGFNLIRTSDSKVMMIVLVLVGLICAETLAAEVKGTLTIGTGYLDHPLGVVDEPAAGYLSEALRLSTTLGEGEDKLRLGYEGNASQFGSNTSLGSARHGLGVEWFRNKPDGRQGLSAGVQGAIRRYVDYYKIYDYGEAYSYFALKKYIGDQTLLRGFAALRFRSFGSLPEESYLEPHGRIELQHYSESRTTVGVAMKLGAKYYNDKVASQVWGTSQIPSVSQLAARLNFAQGLSDRFSLKSWLEGRWNLSDFPRYVADDVYDSPLLDTYAHEGFDAYAGFKWLAPKQTWVEFGLSYGDHDYGSLLFAIPEGGATRVDQVFSVGLSFERQISFGIGKPRFKLNGGWEHQDSSLEGYTYDGPYAATSLSWQW